MTSEFPATVTLFHDQLTKIPLSELKAMKKIMVETLYHAKSSTQKLPHYNQILELENLENNYHKTLNHLKQT